MLSRMLSIALILVGAGAHAQSNVAMTPPIAIDPDGNLECSLFNEGPNPVTDVLIQEYATTLGSVRGLGAADELAPQLGIWRGASDGSMRVAQCRFLYTGSCDSVSTSICSRSVDASGQTTARACLSGRETVCSELAQLETDVVQGRRFRPVSCAISNHGGTPAQAAAELLDEDGNSVAAENVFVAPGETRKLQHTPYSTKSFRCRVLFGPPDAHLTTRIFTAGAEGESLDGSEGRRLD